MSRELATLHASVAIVLHWQLVYHVLPSHVPLSMDWPPIKARISAAPEVEIQLQDALSGALQVSSHSAGHGFP